MQFQKALTFDLCTRRNSRDDHPSPYWEESWDRFGIEVPDGPNLRMDELQSVLGKGRRAIPVMSDVAFSVSFLDAIHR